MLMTKRYDNGKMFSTRVLAAALMTAITLTSATPAFAAEYDNTYVARERVEHMHEDHAMTSARLAKLLKAADLDDDDADDSGHSGPSGSSAIG